MIKTVVDMLERFLEKEKSVLASENVTHTTTIGTMWENVSKDLLLRSLPCDDLTVGSGFVEHSNGSLGKELDCVLAIGEGRKLPRVDKFVYKPEQIVAIIQVKRSLYTNGLADGFENLNDILNFDIKPPENFIDTVRRCFQIISNVPLPDDVSCLPYDLKALYRTLQYEALHPCRILLGYYGFKTEQTFRDGIVKHLTSLVNIPGWGPPSFPGFIIGNKFAAVKNSAMPYGHRTEDGWTPLYMTTSSISPVEVLIEAIWTRLNFIGRAPAFLFGDDRTLERFNALIDARALAEAKWELRIQNPATLSNDCSEGVDWEPHFVSEPAFVLANYLCFKSPDPVSTQELANVPDLSDAIDELENCGLAARCIDDPHQVRLLTVSCDCVILPDGRFAVGENNTGRLSRWVEYYRESRRTS